MKFKQGMWIEAVDSHLTESVCPANIYAVMGPYAIKVRFPGWSEDYDQWKPINSTELYPIGWSRLVGHALAPPGSEITDFSHVFDYGENENDVGMDSKPEIQEEKKPLVERKNLTKRGQKTRATKSTRSRSPTKKRNGGKRKARGSLTSGSENESENELISSTPRARAGKPVSAGKRARVSSKLQFESSAEKVENGEGRHNQAANTRRSSRSRNTTAFYGNNVDKRLA